MKIYQEESASALIEFALIVPVFIVLLTGAMNYGIALQKSSIAADSARAGAQAALVKGYYTNTTQMQTVATTSAASASIPDYQAVATNFCTCSPGSGTTTACNSLCPNYGQAAMYAQVTVTGTVPLLFGKVAGISIRSVARVRIPCPAC